MLNPLLVALPAPVAGSASPVPALLILSPAKVATTPVAAPGAAALGGAAGDRARPWAPPARACDGRHAVAASVAPARRPHRRAGGGTRAAGGGVAGSPQDRQLGRCPRRDVERRARGAPC